MSTTEYREGQLREELALTKQQLKNEMNKSWGLESDLAESQLHIKELREVLEVLREEFNHLPRSLGYLLTHAPQIDSLLAKQPDTRALEKVVIEARIEALEDFGQAAGFGSTKLISLVARYKNTLAELNKV